MERTSSRSHLTTPSLKILTLQSSHITQHPPQVAREREAPARSDDAVRVDPICDVEFEGGMYRIVQLLDKACFVYVSVLGACGLW